MPEDPSNRSRLERTAVPPLSSSPRRWVRWAVGAVVVIAAAVVGGPFIYIHYIEGPAPQPLTITNQPVTTLAGGPSSTASSPSSLDGTWKVAAGSQAGYRIKETLFGQSNTAVGRTSVITGSMTVSGTSVPAATFTVDMTTVTSDRTQRDGQFQGRIM